MTFYKKMTKKTFHTKYKRFTKKKTEDNFNLVN